MRMLAPAVALALSAVVQNPPAGAQQPQIPVQLSVSVSPDTVTVGQRFVAIIRIRAPLGAVIEFPQENDSEARASPTATQLIGKPAVQPVTDSTSTTMSAAYRLAAWDVGLQPLGIGDIVVRLKGGTGYVSLADRSVLVRSVLPKDSTLRIPKPPRAAIGLLPFNWLPWMIVALVAALAALLWRLWVWYRRRRSAPLDPFSAAERDFARIEAMGLIVAGEPGRHAALMSDVMREYLAARVAPIERSHTSSELLAASGDIDGAARGLGELLWRTDLIKFANESVAADAAERLGASARGIVHAVELFLVDRQKQRVEKAA